MSVGDQMGNLLQKDNFFAILPNVFMDFLSRIIQTFLRKDTYLESNLEVYQSIRSFAIRKGIKMERRKYFEKRLGTLMENGLVRKLYRETPPSFPGLKLEKRGGEDGFVHYNGLQDYITANTKVEALLFDKLDYLFRIYLALVTAVLFVNLTHYHGKKKIRLFQRICRLQLFLYNPSIVSWLTKLFRDYPWITNRRG